MHTLVRLVDMDAAGGILLLGLPGRCRMCERRVVEPAEEIRDLHRRQCACANRINAGIESEARQVADRCRTPESPDMPELQHFGNVFECQDAPHEAGRDPRVRRWMKLAYMVNCAVLFGGCLLVQLYTASFFAMVLVGTLPAAVLLRPLGGM
jgi:hypothetical protein